MFCTISKPVSRIHYHPMRSRVYREPKVAGKKESSEGRDEKVSTFNPPTNVLETQENFIVDVAVPGYNREEISIEIDGNQLVLTGEKKLSETMAKYRLHEFNTGRFRKIYRIPSTVDVSNIDATVQEGILTIKLNKKAEFIPQPPRKINIV